MKYKKIFILPLLFICSNILYIGCCHCVNEGMYFFKINSVRVQAAGSGNSKVDTGAITMVDTIYLSYDFMGGCVAKQTNNYSFLVNTALATSCKCNFCGEQGMKNKVAEISISSDSVYNAIPANQSLNHLFKVENGNQSFLPFDSVKALINRPPTYYFFRAVITTKPGNSKGHIFKLKMKFDNGEEMFVDSRRIYWM